MVFKTDFQFCLKYEFNDENIVESKMENGEYEETFPSLWGATITDGERTVEIVFDDMDAWGLGHPPL